MIDDVTRRPGTMLGYVKALEHKESKARGELILSILKSLGIEPSIQRCFHPGIKNLVVDFLPSPSQKIPVFSAHYDVVTGSPGANDDASGVAVLLKLCEHLKQYPAPARIIFFDREEAWIRTPALRFGLLGSLYYVLRKDLSDVSSVFNLEFCGSGEVLAVWPVKSRQRALPALKAVEAAASSLKLPLRAAHLPWLLLSSDHLPFRFKGIASAVTLSLLPVTQIPDFEKWVSELSFLRLLTGRKPLPPEALSVIHTPEDTASRLGEESLAVMLSLLLQILRDRSNGGQSLTQS